jgi:hypothetical protein
VDKQAQIFIHCGEEIAGKSLLTKTSLQCKLVCMKNPIMEYIRLVRTIQRAKREGRTGELIRAAKESAELQKLVLQPKRYETINGAGEIGWGTAMLCFAVSSYSAVLLPASPWRGWIGFAFLGVACVAMPLCLWASRRFVTWPRVGYVAFRRDKSWWVIIIVSVVIGGGLGAILPLLLMAEMPHPVPGAVQAAGHSIVRLHTEPGTPTLAGNLLKFTFGPLSALLYLMFNAVSIKEHRWKWLLLALIATVPVGIAFLVPGTYTEACRPMMLSLGLIWFVSGSITLISFIRHHQPPAPEAE